MRTTKAITNKLYAFINLCLRKIEVQLYYKIPIQELFNRTKQILTVVKSGAYSGTDKALVDCKVLNGM